ncbi:MAG: hypothetical protein ONB05_07030, partial [candidate division KSB1 bacterium]|nr:hypothetical protein [candidate division KSB1 bacterium]
MSKRLMIFTFFGLIGASSLISSPDTLIVKEPAVPLTSGSYRFFHPCWSPDGMKIAVTSDNYQGLWVMNEHGGNIRQLSDAERVGYGFAWSSDSREIACRIARIIKNRRLSAIQIIDVATGNSRQITDYRNLVGLPLWADNDQKIYFTANHELQILSSERKKNPNQERPVMKAPKSEEQIIYQSLGRIIVSNLQGTQQTILVSPESRFLNMTLSPDQKKIAFEMTDGHIYVMNIDGTELRDLGNGSQPRWSPAGNRLVYFIAQDDGERIVSSDIYAIKTDGSQKMLLTDTPDRIEMNPDWSPDGKKIIFDD